MYACKHQQIKEEVSLFNNQVKRHLDSFVDRESRSALFDGVAHLEWTRSRLHVTNT